MVVVKGSVTSTNLTWHVVGSFHHSGDGQLVLGVTLIKLSLEDGEQTGDPVVQTYVQDELWGRREDRKLTGSHSATTKTARGLSVLGAVSKVSQDSLLTPPHP